MPIQTTTNIWHNGTLIPWEQANIHVMSHVIHYGSSVFEGIRCYGQPHGSAVFRLTPVEVYIANFPWGKYIAGHGGADVCISSWHRLAPNTLPSLAKAGANYMNSQLIQMEAAINGYQEGIALDVNGLVSEGSGENIFVVRNGVLYTPPLANSTLSGITRDSVLTIARHLGLAVTEQSLPRELLYIADEVFFSGTAAEVSPIRSIDRIVIGDGKTGEITKKIADEFFGIANGLKPDRFGWLTPVKVNAAEPIAV